MTTQTKNRAASLTADLLTAAESVAKANGVTIPREELESAFRVRAVGRGFAVQLAADEEYPNPHTDQDRENVARHIVGRAIVSRGAAKNTNGHAVTIAAGPLAGPVTPPAAPLTIGGLPAGYAAELTAEGLRVLIPAATLADVFAFLTRLRNPA